MCAVQSGHSLFIWSWLYPMIVNIHYLFLLSTLVAQMLLTPRYVRKQRGVKQLSKNTSKAKVGVKNSISRRTTFFPNPHLVEKKICFLFSIWCELNYIAICLCSNDIDLAVVNRATQDTFFSLKVKNFWHFHIPFFESIFILFMTKKCDLVSTTNHYHISHSSLDDSKNP